MLWRERTVLVSIDDLPDVQIDTWMKPNGHVDGRQREHHVEITNGMSVRLGGELTSELKPQDHAKYLKTPCPNMWEWKLKIAKFARLQGLQLLSLVAHVASGETAISHAEIKATLYEEAMIEQHLRRASRKYSGGDVLSID